jgi:glycosidase
VTDPGALPGRTIRLARSARRRLQLEPPILEASGALDARDTAAARRVAARLNRERAAAAAAAAATARPAPGMPAPATATPAPSVGPQVGAGDLVALAALGAVLHRVIARETETASIDVAAASARAKAALGGAASAVERAWSSEFGVAEPSAMPADLLVIATLNENPAVAPLRELVDDRPLRRTTEYRRFVASLEQELAAAAPPASPGAGRQRRGRGATAGDGASLAERLRAPIRNAPDSLQAQLRWIREHWAPLLDEDPALAARVALALDVIAEEHRALELAAAAAARATAFGGPVAAETPDYRGLDAEPEAFSVDTDWMPSVVLLAKASYVWLEQLAARFGRPVVTLADVPDAELDRLAGLGVTGLWLIGVWQRSAASAEIKRRRGDADAVASAYSVDDYRIADDLGGEPAFEELRGRAMARGIRIAADMVPNHMGLDSRWVVEHPEWFIAVPEPPFPGYAFGGPNLSPDPGVEITIEDHYWDSTDAAVVFRRRDTDPARAGDVRYVYHGNDGTSFPWNDTAQLDYLNPAVREAVIRTILDVARRAPIIRFDAAMVLARRHIRRLWYPAPGAGGAIPSRAEHAMSDAEFNRRMPKEFWREVVDRVATEAPGTLLLAEAFWLLEGYFVRTLGMHRVYNSAFMHMLRDEDNAGYRKVMKDTLEFDPRVLQRFVNFMTNPDERPAAEQYGTGDKAFAAATLLATLPGLPMLGHGQVEGYRERYGHEFRKARWDEPVDQAHLDHFERTIVPLLRRRPEFAGADRFRLYDATDGGGHVNEDVYAFSNAHGGRHSLVVVHHHHGEAVVTIDRSAAARRSGGGGPLTRTRLADDLELRSGDPGSLVRFRDPRTGWEQVRTAGELRERGLSLHLGAYEARVLDIEPAWQAPVDEPAAVPSPAPPKRAPKARATGRATAPREPGPAKPQPPKSARRSSGRGSSPRPRTDSR